MARGKITSINVMVPPLPWRDEMQEPCVLCGQRNMGGEHRRHPETCIEVYICPTCWRRVAEFGKRMAQRFDIPGSPSEIAFWIELEFLKR